MLVHSQNNLKMRIKKWSISFQPKFMLWHGTISMKYCIVVVKLLESMNGWLKQTHRDNWLTWKVMVILKWFQLWLWCQNYNFWQQEDMMENWFCGILFPKQRSSIILDILDPFRAWRFMKVWFCCLVLPMIILFVFGIPTFNLWFTKSSTTLILFNLVSFQIQIYW